MQIGLFDDVTQLGKDILATGAAGARESTLRLLRERFPTVQPTVQTPAIIGQPAPTQTKIPVKRSPWVQAGDIARQVAPFAIPAVILLLMMRRRR